MRRTPNCNERIFDRFIVKVDAAKVLGGGSGCCFLRKILSLRKYLW
jgi:hypothetical protein